MPPKTEMDDFVVEACKQAGSMSPVQIAKAARDYGALFYTTDTVYGWNLGRRLVKAGRLVQTGKSRFSVPHHDAEIFGMPEVGDLDPDALKRIKACFLLAATEMTKVEEEAHGTLQDWMHGAINACNRNAAFLDIMIEGEVGCEGSQDSTS